MLLKEFVKDVTHSDPVFLILEKVVQEGSGSWVLKDQLKDVCTHDFENSRNNKFKVNQLNRFRSSL